MPGRELNSEVPYKSDPDVISNGAPEFKLMNGLNRMFHLVLTDPPMNARFRISFEDGPYSPTCEYGFEGYVPSPSVLLMALFSM